MPGQSYVVAIAVETYQNSGINPVEFARNDAEAFANVAVEHLGVSRDNVELWVNEGATRTQFMHELPYHVRHLGPEDRFLFFYAGHGLWARGSNRLTAWDTHPRHLAETTVDLEQVLLGPLRESSCDQSLVFIDACAASFDEPGLLGRDILSNMSRPDFEAFVSKSIHTAAFFSCSPNEKSYPSATLKHGIWTHHLLRALRGEEPRAADRGIVTGQALQNYLAVEVPKFIRENMRKPGKQRPYALIGSGGSFLVRRMPEPKASTADAVIRPDFGTTCFRGRETRRFDRLPGFSRSKKHTIPTEHSDSAEGWAQRLLQDEVRSELDQVYQNAKRILKLKRREISGPDMDPGGSGGSVDTDYFRFEIGTGQNRENPGEAVIERVIILRVPQDELPSDFDAIFPENVTEIVVAFPTIDKKEYNDLADRLEDAAPDVEAEYEENPRTKVLTLKFLNGSTLVFDTKRQEMVIQPAGAVECLPMIEALKNGAFPTLFGDGPLLIGKRAEE